MEFYGAVLGWAFERRADTRGEPYYVAVLAGEPVAGIRPARRTRPYWTVYLATPDLARLTSRAIGFGGRAVAEAEVLPGVGTTALVEAPAGAVFGACQLAGDWAFTAGVPRSLVWAEYITHHAQAADEYFGELFGFTGRQFGDGIADDYMVWYAGEDSVIGRVRMMPGTPAEVPARWIAHFEINPEEAFDDVVSAAHQLGGRLRFRPYVSTLGRVAVLYDSTGARFALIDPAQAAEDGAGQGPGSAAVDDPFDD
jgi:uncharacterized protein